MRVLMMTQNSLLGDALESILSQAINLFVRRLLYSNAEGLLQATNDYQPEVIILEEGILCDSSLAFSNHWAINGRLCLILVNPQVNQIYIHDKFQVTLTCAADFIALLQNCSSQWQNTLSLLSHQAYAP